MDMYSKRSIEVGNILRYKYLLAIKIYRQDCEKKVKLNFRLWANRGFPGKRNCIFTITSNDIGHYCTVQVPVS